MLVTSRLREGLPSLRRPETLAILHESFHAGGDRFGLRLVEFSVQSNHLHWILEVEDEAALTRGMQGLLVRIAKALNKHWGRKGRVFDDRYHACALKTPREVRNAIVYVLGNVRKHGGSRDPIDPYSSGPWFRGFADARPADRTRLATRAPPGVTAQRWLLREGWKRHGLVSVREGPSPTDVER